MPRMIPDLDPSSISNPGEKDLYKALKDQLPDDWVVRYHYPACWMRGTYLRECESDFIVLVPGKGLMFLEVKSSHGYDSQDGIWYRIEPSGKRVKMDKNPWFQAANTKHQIVRKFSHRLGLATKGEFPGVYGHMVIFPRARIEGKLPESIDSKLVILRKHMRSLVRCIEDSFALWELSNDPACWFCKRPFGKTTGMERVGKAQLFTPAILEKILSFLKDDCQFVPVISPTIDDDEQVIEELTRQQYRAFQQLLQNNRVAVRGTAGSGKTMIAFWIAQSLAEKGERVLFLCYNRQLAKWLELKNGPSVMIAIKSFFSFCSEICKSQGVPFKIPNNKNEEDIFWKETAPNLAMDAFEKVADDDKFDVVVVDEAQDFHKDWWFPVQACNKHPDTGRMFLFLDPHQEGVYGHGDRYPSSGLVVQDLGENCRNTKKIVNYCSKVIDSEILPFELSPEGFEPQVLDPIVDVSHRAQQVRKLISTLLAEGFGPSQIAILTPWVRKKSSLNYLGHVDNIPIGFGEDAVEKWLNDELILGSTIKSFKGMEADFLIVTDVPEVGKFHFEISDLYVATSRAKHRLVLIPSYVESKDQLEAFNFSLKKDRLSDGGIGCRIE